MRVNTDETIANFQKQQMPGGLSRTLLLEVAVFSLYNALHSLEKSQVNSALIIGKKAMESIVCSAAPKSV